MQMSAKYHASLHQSIISCDQTEAETDRFELKLDLRGKTKSAEMACLRWFPLVCGNLLCGAGRGTRTPTLSPTPDFESGASTNSAIPA